MWTRLVLSFLLVFICKGHAQRCGVRFQSRVVSGVSAVPHSWPWQAQILRGGHFCGATLIHPLYVVTAAHCVDGSHATDFIVRLGEHNLSKNESSQQDFNVTRIFVHPQYGRPTTLNNDIAVMVLERPAVLTGKVKLACLPQQGVDVPLDYTCYITGWGNTFGGGPTPDQLQEARLPLVTNAQCAKGNADISINITKNMLCAGFGGNSSVSGCHGDSGGPFVCQNSGSGLWFLQGSVSWGSSRCSAGKTYTVFARTSELRNFIDSAMAPLPTSYPSVGSCNFERGFCGWMQKSDDQFDWTIHFGSTRSFGTGPSTDHTTSLGQYAYIETSSPRRQADQARLVSPPLDSSRCLVFYYHMYGRGMGALRIKVVLNVFLSKVVWELNGDQGDKWYRASVPLNISSTYRVILEGERGFNYQGDAAVDDIMFHSLAYCQLSPLNTTPTLPTIIPSPPHVTSPAPPTHYLAQATL